MIKTKSFGLATYEKGDPSSSRLALILPGRLDTKDYAHCVSHVNYLAGKDFYALSFDPPGTWESPGRIELFTTTNYLKAIDELIEYFGNKPTLLLGHSRGGSVAMLAGTSNRAVKGLVVVMANYGAPSSPTPEAERTGFNIEYRDLPPGISKTSKEKQKRFDLPINYFRDGEKYQPVASLRKCAKPKLLFYGTHDKFTKPERVKEVYEAIPKPKMIHELNTEHDYRYHQEIIENVNRTTGEFLRQYFS